MSHDAGRSVEMIVLKGADAATIAIGSTPEYSRDGEAAAYLKAGIKLRNIAFTLPPMAVAPATMQIETIDAIRAYSMEVAPFSSAQNLAIRISNPSV